jgi:cysteine desulfurase
MSGSPATTKSAPIYLDYNATTPLSTAVREAMRPYVFEVYGNPSSAHSYGQITSAAVKEARECAARAIGCDPQEFVILSGGTESDNYAIKGAAYTQRDELSHGNHIITCSVEHPAVAATVEYLRSDGFDVTVLDVDATGRVSVDDLKAAITSDTILVTIMMANNEVGTVMPIKELCSAAKSLNENILFHTDACQAVGKIPVDVHDLGVDYLSLAAHKFYAPAGIGALYIRSGTPKLRKLIHGAGHENGLRAGTENVIHIVGMGKALDVVHHELKSISAHLADMRDRLLDKIAAKLKAHAEHTGTDSESGVDSSTLFIVNGHPQYRLPNTLSISFRDITCKELIPLIQSKVACSAGSACHGDLEVSMSLRASKYYTVCVCMCVCVCVCVCVCDE